jgi:hypothetical protein
MRQNSFGLNGIDTGFRRASADYRRHIVGGLFKDVLETAWKRAV